MATGCKLFKIKDGELFTLYVNANQPIPIGVWLEAEQGELTSDGKHVKSKLGPLANRPGWHLCESTPYVNHIGKKGKDGKLYRAADTVWALVEYSDSIDYQVEANLAGMRNGKIIARDACLKRVPVNGYYRYKTSAKMHGVWIIAGAIRIIRVLSEDEVNQMCLKDGLAPQPFLDNVI